MNAFVHALENLGIKDFKLTDYRQHSIGGGSATESAAFIQLQPKAEERPMAAGLTQYRKERLACPCQRLQQNKIGAKVQSLENPKLNNSEHSPI